MINSPKLKKRIRTRAKQNVKMLGLNASNEYVDGELESCFGISTEKYPFITTAPSLKDVTSEFRGGSTIGTDGVTTLLAWNRLLHITFNGDVYYGNKKLEGSLPQGFQGYKRLAVINTKVLVVPDNAYIDLGPGLYDDGSQKENIIRFGKPTDITAGMVFAKDVNDERGLHGRITFIDHTKDRQLPAVGAELDIKLTNGKSGTEEVIYYNQANIVVEVKSPYTGDDGLSTIDFANPFNTADFPAGFNGVPRAEIKTAGTSTDDKYAPVLDYICSKNNRIYGCSNRDSTIYVSALGKPDAWQEFNTVSLDSYCVAVGTPGPFTGCCVVGDSVIFTKQHYIHRLVGDYPAEYRLYTYDIDGVMPECDGTLISFNRAAMMKNESEMIVFDGSNASKIRTPVANIIKSTAGCFNGDLCLTALETPDEKGIYCYDPKHSLWTKWFDNIGTVLNITHYQSDDYVVARVNEGGFAKHKVFKLDYEDTSHEWEMTFKPFIETVSGSWGSSSDIFEKKRYTRILFRLNLPEGSTFNIAIKCDDEEEFRDVGSLIGYRDGVQDIAISTPRVDRLQLKLYGKGPMTLLSMEREYQRKESDR